MLDFSSYILARTRNFTGREWVFEAIDDWLQDSRAARVFLLAGEPGSGKTAISARLAQFSRGLASPADSLTQLAPGFLSAVHFCSARDRRWINPNTFAGSLALQLSRRYPVFAAALAEKSTDDRIHIEVRQEAGEIQSGGRQIGVFIEYLDASRIPPEDVFDRVVREPLEAFIRANRDERVVFLVDALDEALVYGGEVSILDLVAQVEDLPVNVRLLLTSREEPRVEGEFLEADGLVLSAAEFTTQVLTDTRCYIQARFRDEKALAERVAALVPAKLLTTIDEIGKKADGNFRYVTFLLDAIARGQRALTDLKGLPPGLDGLYHHDLTRVVKLGRKDWATDYAPLMGVLSVARARLTSDQLMAFSGQAKDEAWQHLIDLQQYVEAIEVGGAEKEEFAYQLYHQSVVDFFAKRVLAINRKRLPNRFFLPAMRWHRQIADHCLTAYGPDWYYYDDYAIEHTRYHLQKAILLADHPSEAALRQELEDKVTSLAESEGYRTGVHLSEQAKRFYARERVFQAVDGWLVDPEGSVVFLITGEPGSGKTALVQQLVHLSRCRSNAPRYPQVREGVWMAAHFCHVADTATLDPLRFVESISRQLAGGYDGFVEALVRLGESETGIALPAQVDPQSRGEVWRAVVESMHIERASAMEAFYQLVHRPLEEIRNLGLQGTIVIVVDAANEAVTWTGRESIVDLVGQIVGNPKALPHQVRFLVTTRADPRVVYLLGAPSLDLTADAPSGPDDVWAYIYLRLGVLPEPRRKDLSDRIAGHAQGNWLYARLVLDQLLADLDPDALDSLDLSRL